MSISFNVISELLINCFFIISHFFLAESDRIVSDTSAQKSKITEKKLLAMETLEEFMKAERELLDEDDKRNRKGRRY